MVEFLCFLCAAACDVHVGVFGDERSGDAQADKALIAALDAAASDLGRVGIVSTARFGVEPLRRCVSGFQVLGELFGGPVGPLLGGLGTP